MQSDDEYVNKMVLTSYKDTLFINILKRKFQEYSFLRYSPKSFNQRANLRVFETNALEKYSIFIESIGYIFVYSIFVFPKII